MSEGPGRTLSGWSEGPPGAVDAPSLAAASAVTDLPAGDAATDSVTAAVGSHILNLDDIVTSPKGITGAQGDDFGSAGAELDVAQSPEGSAGGTFTDVPGDKNGATPAASSAGGSVLGRMTSTLGRQASVSPGTGPAAAVPATGPLPLPRERVRAPAWCDRILYRCESSGTLAQLLYDRSELVMSDHKPVMAAFLLNAIAIDGQRLAEQSEGAQKALDLLANNAQPRCTVGENVLEVGELGYGEVVTRSCSLTCSGEVRQVTACMCRCMN